MAFEVLLLSLWLRDLRRKATIVLERIDDGKIRSTSSAWTDPIVILDHGPMEGWMLAGARMRQHSALLPLFGAMRFVSWERAAWKNGFLSHRKKRKVQGELAAA
jgi:hypothetical protein